MSSFLKKRNIFVTVLAVDCVYKFTPIIEAKVRTILIKAFLAHRELRQLR